MRYHFPSLCRICDFCCHLFSPQTIPCSTPSLLSKIHQPPRTSPTCPVDVCEIVLTFVWYLANIVPQLSTGHIRNKQSFIFYYGINQSYYSASQISFQTFSKSRDQHLSLFWPVEFLHQPDQFVVQWHRTSALTLSLTGYLVVILYLQLLACSAWCNNERWGSQPGWADSQLYCHFYTRPKVSEVQQSHHQWAGREYEREIEFFFLFFLPKGTSAINITLTILWFANEGCQRREDDAGSCSVLELF